MKDLRPRQRSQGEFSPRAGEIPTHLYPILAYMAVHIRAQCRFPQSTALPADVVCINPCFRNTLAAPGWDADGLAQDLADGLAGWQLDSANPVEVRLYDIESTKPVYPMAIAKANPGNLAANISQPQEIAVCLSFYADHPEPRRRGR